MGAASVWTVLRDRTGGVTLDHGSYERGTASEDPPGWERHRLGKSFGTRRAAPLVTSWVQTGHRLRRPSRSGAAPARQVLRDEKSCATHDLSGSEGAPPSTTLPVGSVNVRPVLRGGKSCVTHDLWVRTRHRLRRPSRLGAVSAWKVLRDGKSSATRDS